MLSRLKTVICEKKEKLLFLAVTYTLAACILMALSFAYEEQASVEYSGSVRTLVLDPGHGGADGGATGRSGTKEKEINLKIALVTRELCHFLGIPTLMTRQEDISLSSATTLRRQKAEDLQKRLEIAQDATDPLYVAIHQNIYGDRVSRGAQTFYHAGNQAGQYSARLFQKRLVEFADMSNKRKAAKNPNKNFLLENLTCPAVIVECGFLSHPEEEMLLNSPAYRRKIAFAICAGVFDVFGAAQKGELG